ncbi:Pre-mRNA-splicing factor ISY1 like protein [Verticillium longisporum]|nr:Pre-mRNA-splicing factor ISY1 like protein [Verticillium longisporum]
MQSQKYPLGNIAQGGRGGGGAARSLGAEDRAAKGREQRPRVYVDAAYYGYAPDEEDDELLQYEAQKEAEATEHMANTGKQEAPPGWEPLPGDSGDGQVWVLPTLEEVQEELIDRRRKRLLDQL